MGAIFQRIMLSVLLKEVRCRRRTISMAVPGVLIFEVKKAEDIYIGPKGNSLECHGWIIRYRFPVIVHSCRSVDMNV